MLIGARKEIDNSGITHVNLAAFEESADGNKYCLVAAVTIELEKGVQVVTHLRSNAVEGLCVCSSSHQRSSNSAVKTAIYIKSPALDLCKSSNCANPSRRRRRIQQSRSSRTYGGTRTSFCPFLRAHQPSSNGIAEQKNPWYSEEHHPSNAEASTSRTRMVVICMRVLQVT